jgi:hypothetical protein
MAVITRAFLPVAYRCSSSCDEIMAATDQVHELIALPAMHAGTC